MKIRLFRGIGMLYRFTFLGFCIENAVDCLFLYQFLNNDKCHKVQNGYIVKTKDFN